MKKRVLALTLCFVLILNVVAVASDGAFIVRDMDTGTVMSFSATGELLGGFISQHRPTEPSHPWVDAMFAQGRAVHNLMVEVGAFDIDELWAILQSGEITISEANRATANDMLRFPVVPFQYTESRTEGKLDEESYVVVRDMATGATMYYCMLTNEPLGEFIMPPTPRRAEPSPHMENAMALNELMVNVGANDIDELLKIIQCADSAISADNIKLANELIGDIFGLDLSLPRGVTRGRVLNTRVDPYNAISLLEIQFVQGGSWSMATAFMVNNNHAFTAGHNILNGGEWTLGMRVSPGATMTQSQYGVWFVYRPFGRHYVGRASVGAVWARYGGVSTANSGDGDFGVMMLYTNPLGPSPLVLRAASDVQTANRPVIMAGFPYVQNLSTYLRGTMVRSSGRIYNVLPFQIHTTAIGNPGVSGAPMLNEAGEAIAVATGSVYANPLHGNTRGVRITPGIINWLRSLGAQ